MSGEEATWCGGTLQGCFIGTRQNRGIIHEEVELGGMRGSNVWQLISSGYTGISLVRPQKHLAEWDQGFVSLLMFGGAEVALHRLGVPLKALVAVEIYPGN